MSAERAQEEILAELRMDRQRGRKTYTEVAECAADLSRLQRWLASIRKRDYFDAPAYANAAQAVGACRP